MKIQKLAKIVLPPSPYDFTLEVKDINEVTD